MENKDNILKNSMNKSCIKCEECPNNCKQEIKKEKSTEQKTYMEFFRHKPCNGKCKRRC